MSEHNERDAELIAAIVRDQLPGYVLVRDPPPKPGPAPTPTPHDPNNPEFVDAVSPPIDVLRAHFARFAPGGVVGSVGSTGQRDRVGIFRVESSHPDAKGSPSKTVVISLTDKTVLSMQG